MNVDRSCRRIPNGRRAAAFTLLEVLVALLVFTGVLATLFATWTIVMRSNAAALRLTAEAQRARMAIRTVEDAIVATEMVAGRNARHYSFEANTGGDFADLSLVGHLSESFPGSGFFGDERVRRVRFEVVDSELIMRQNSMLAPKEEKNTGYPLVLARDVKLFQLEFWDIRRGDWAPEWLPTNQLPALIRVTLGVGAPEKANPDQIVARVIRLPAAGIQPGLQGAPN